MQCRALKPACKCITNYFTNVYNFVSEQVMARSVIAPTYFYPEATDGWAKVAMAAMYLSAVMVNPDSGPGARKLQDFAAVAKQSQAAGIHVLGYIPSGYGTRDIADVVSEINSYRTWYEVDGFFIDEMYTAGEQRLPSGAASFHIPLLLLPYLCLLLCRHL